MNDSDRSVNLSSTVGSSQVASSNKTKSADTGIKIKNVMPVKLNMQFEQGCAQSDDEVQAKKTQKVIYSKIIT